MKYRGDAVDWGAPTRRFRKALLRARLSSSQHFFVPDRMLLLFAPEYPVASVLPHMVRVGMLYEHMLV